MKFIAASKGYPVVSLTVTLPTSRVVSLMARTLYKLQVKLHLKYELYYKLSIALQRQSTFLAHTLTLKTTKHPYFKVECILLQNRIIS